MVCIYNVCGFERLFKVLSMRNRAKNESPEGGTPEQALCFFAAFLSVSSFLLSFASKKHLQYCGVEVSSAFACCGTLLLGVDNFKNATASCEIYCSGCHNAC